MDKQLLDYYEQELTWLRLMGTEFGQRYPRVAGHLGLDSTPVSDPYVERLLEGVAFLTARIQLKMDAEFPDFCQQLLAVLYPHALTALPSMALVELQPDDTKGDISRGYRVPRGSQLEDMALQKQGVICRYRTAHEVVLQPLRIQQVQLGAIPADLPAGDASSQAALSALRISLRSFDSVTLGEMDCNSIMFYLSGAQSQAQQLLALIMEHRLAVVCQINSDPLQRLWLAPSALRHEGFEPDQALLVQDARHLDAHRLAQEYFNIPQRLMFFSINGLGQLISQAGPTRDMEIIILLDDAEPGLERQIGINDLALHCTPVINLFEQTAEAIILDPAQHEYRVVVDNIHPQAYEILAINRLRGYAQQGDWAGHHDFLPLYQSRIGSQANNAAWFSQRRVEQPAHDDGQLAGSEVYLSVMDENTPPWPPQLVYLQAGLWCCNRQLPPAGTLSTDRFILRDSVPVKGIRLHCGPGAPSPPLARGDAGWRLINQLQMNYFSLMDNPGDGCAAALRQMLEIYAGQAGQALLRQIAGIVDCRIRPVTRQLPYPMMVTRGVGIHVTVDEQAFSGLSPWLLGSVLARLFTRLASINSFTETTLYSLQRGKIGYWPAHTGEKNPL